MQVVLNGENQELPDRMTVSQLLTRLEVTHRRVAVEINRLLVTRSSHEETMIQPGDQIEIVSLVGGG